MTDERCVVTMSKSRIEFWPGRGMVSKGGKRGGGRHVNCIPHGCYGLHDTFPADLKNIERKAPASWRRWWEYLVVLSATAQRCSGNSKSEIWLKTSCVVHMCVCSDGTKTLPNAGRLRSPPARRRRHRRLHLIGPRTLLRSRRSKRIRRLWFSPVRCFCHCWCRCRCRSLLRRLFFLS